MIMTQLFNQVTASGSKSVHKLLVVWSVLPVCYNTPSNILRHRQECMYCICLTDNNLTMSNMIIRDKATPKLCYPLILMNTYWCLCFQAGLVTEYFHIAVLVLLLKDLNSFCTSGVRGKTSGKSILEQLPINEDNKTKALTGTCPPPFQHKLNSHSESGQVNTRVVVVSVTMWWPVSLSSSKDIHHNDTNCVGIMSTIGPIYVNSAGMVRLKPMSAI